MGAKTYMVAKKNWSVYLVLCLDGSLYTGVTNDLEKRMSIHKSGKGSKYIRAKGFDKLLAVKDGFDKISAMKEEYRIKNLTKENKIKYFEAKLKI